MTWTTDGRWTKELQAQRDEARAHAAQLAEVLRKVAARLDHNGRVESHWQEGYDVRAALAAYEAAR